MNGLLFEIIMYNILINLLMEVSELLSDIFNIKPLPINIENGIENS